MGILWTIIIGFIAGVIAKFIMPGDNEPSGFILTTILGIVGAFVASYLGQALGWYRPGEGAGLIGAVVGAIIVLFVYGSSPAGNGDRSKELALMVSVEPGPAARSFVLCQAGRDASSTASAGFRRRPQFIAWGRRQFER